MNIEKIMNALPNNGMSLVLVFVAVFLVYGLIVIIWQMRKKGQVKEWLKEHQDAAMVFYNTNMIRLGTITIHSVNDEEPRFCRKGMKIGFYVLPGTNVIESSYTHSRPGIFYRRVITTYEPSKQEIAVQANKAYLYPFNKKEQTYSFTQMD